jgi:serine/threonine protein kinase
MAAKKLNPSNNGMSNVYDVQLEAKRREELLAEVRVLVELQHPSVVRVLGVCLDPGHECVLMELAKNGTVRDLLDHVLREQKQQSKQEQEPLPPLLLFSLLRDVILGMQHAHAHQPSSILHRDLKPANILLSDQYRALVSDFGLAAGAASADEDQKDDNSGVCGSLAYSPPEVLEAMAIGSGALKAASVFAKKPKPLMNGWSTRGDVFSFGVMAYEMATGRVPYSDADHTAASLFRDVVRKEKRPHGSKHDVLPADCDPFIAGIITKCWAQKKEDRPSFEELGEEFEKASREEERFKTAESVRDELRELVSRYQGGASADNSSDGVANDPDRTTAGTILDMLASRRQGLDVSKMEERIFDHEYGVDAVPEENKRDLTTSFLRFYSGMFRDDQLGDESDEDPFGEDNDHADPFGEDESANP